MTNTAALLQISVPGDIDARWNFPDAVGTRPAAMAGLADAATVTYSFMAGPPAYESAADHPGFTAFDGALQAAAAQALATWAGIANLDFVPFADSGEGGEIRFGRNAMTAGGYTWLPSFDYRIDADGLIAAASPASRAGDVWLSTEGFIDAQAAGEYGRYALLHEIGHAIGLKHPFDGSARLPEAESDLGHTVMGYAAPGDFGLVTVTGSPDAYRWTASTLYPSTPMPADIAAVQSLYGVNWTTHAGNDDYAWAPGERILQTIWDGGGVDTIDAGNQLLPNVIDLQPGHASSIGLRLDVAARRAELPDWATQAPTPTYDGRDNLWIADGVSIENAVGGAGDDTLIGNAADNELSGGAGWDMAVLPGQAAQTLLAERADGIWDAIGPGGHDILAGIEAVRFDDTTVALPQLLIA